MSKVTLAIPNTGRVHSLMIEPIVLISNDSRHEVRLDLFHGVPIEASRNEIVLRFLESGGDYLLFIDDDNPPINNPLDLIEEDPDVMIYPTPTWGHNLDRNICVMPIKWNVYELSQPCRSGEEPTDSTTYYESAVWDKEGSFEIECGGSGCMLIARRVLEKVRKPFMRRFDDDGLCVQGSDFVFCQKAKKAGFKIWTNFGYWCRHLKERDLAEMFVMYANAMRLGNERRVEGTLGSGDRAGHYAPLGESRSAGEEDGEISQATGGAQ